MNIPLVVVTIYLTIGAGLRLIIHDAPLHPHPVVRIITDLLFILLWLPGLIGVILGGRR